MTNMPSNFVMVYDVSPDGMNVFLNHGVTPILLYLQGIGINVSQEDLFGTYLREMAYQLFDYRHFTGDVSGFLQALQTLPDISKFTYLEKCPGDMVSQFINTVRYFGYKQFMLLQTSGAFSVATLHNRTMIFDSISLHHMSILYGE